MIDFSPMGLNHQLFPVGREPETLCVRLAYPLTVVGTGCFDSHGDVHNASERGSTRWTRGATGCLTVSDGRSENGSTALSHCASDGKQKSSGEAITQTVVNQPRLRPPCIPN